MEANVTWKGRMTFIGTADSGFNLQMGTDQTSGGDNDGLRPMELIAIGLAGCTAMDVISILQKKKQDVTNFQVRVTADRATDFPKIFTHIHVEYLVEGHGIDPTAVERAIELSVTKYCPVQAMLAKAALIENTYIISEAA